MAEPRDLHCDRFDSCEQSVMYMGSWSATEARARARGWHIFHGSDLAGRPIGVHLCSDCVGSRGRQVKAPEVLEGQLELFEPPPQPQGGVGVP